MHRHRFPRLCVCSVVKSSTSKLFGARAICYMPVPRSPISVLIVDNGFLALLSSCFLHAPHTLYPLYLLAMSISMSLPFLFYRLQKDPQHDPTWCVSRFCFALFRPTGHRRDFEYLKSEEVICNISSLVHSQPLHSLTPIETAISARTYADSGEVPWLSLELPSPSVL